MTSADSETAEVGRGDLATEDYSLEEAEDLTAAAVSGGSWRTLSVFSGALIQVVVSVILARLLTPEDFGALAIVMVVVGIANLLAFLGLGPALVQRKRLDETHVQTAWTLSLIGGLVAALVVAVGAPLLARVVGGSASVALFVAVSPTLVLVGLRTVSLALLRRRLQFRRLMVIEVASYGLAYAPVALAGAWAGWGVWALVAAALCQGVAATILALVYGRHSFRIRIDRPAARELFAFGGGMTASGLASYIALNGDFFIVGRVLGSADLGFYTRAYYLMNLPLTYVAQVLSQVLLPSFARTQDDKARFARGYIASVYLVFSLSAPGMMLMLVAAPYLVTVLFGERWAGAVAPLQVLAVFGALRATYHLGGSVAQAGGKPWSEFLRHVLYAILVVVGSVIGARWGIVGVAWAVGAAIVVMYVAMAQLSHRVTGFRWGPFARAHRTGVVCGAAVLAVGSGSRAVLEWLEWPDAGVLVGLLTAGLATVIAVGWGLPRAWRPDGAERALGVLAAGSRRRCAAW